MSAEIQASNHHHPKGLWVLSAAEVWERFSYYGMRALLVLYLVNAMQMARDDALRIYGIYTGLVYLTPLLGGYLADKYLGQRNAVLIGAILMCVGHFAMAAESLLYEALGFLVVGNGFFKPCATAMVGSLYSDGDNLKREGYSIYYVAINLGAFISPLVCGTLGESVGFGWHWGFAAAGLGMLVGLGTFLAFQRHLGTVGLLRTGPTDIRGNQPDLIKVVAWSASLIAMVFGLIRVLPLATWAWTPPVIAAFPAVLWGYRTIIALVALGAARCAFASRCGVEDCTEKLTPREWRRIVVIGVMAAFSAIFWMGVEQAGSTMTLFADEETDLRVLGHAFPATWYQSVNPVVIFLLAVPLAWLFRSLEKRRSRFALSPFAQQGLGLILAGLGFLVWLLSVYLLHTIGELLVSPVGNAVVDDLAPRRLRSRMQALWMSGSAVAGYLSGTLESHLAAVQKWHGLSLNEFLCVSMVAAGIVYQGLLYTYPPTRNTFAQRNTQ